MLGQSYKTISNQFGTESEHSRQLQNHKAVVGGTPMIDVIPAVKHSGGRIIVGGESGVEGMGRSSSHEEIFKSWGDLQVMKRSSSHGEIFKS